MANETLTLADAARLVLSQVHGNGHPGDMAGLRKLGIAYHALKASGINPKDAAQLRAVGAK